VYFSYFMCFLSHNFPFIFGINFFKSLGTLFLLFMPTLYKGYLCSAVRRRKKVLRYTLFTSWRGVA
jgi:hypothetical protein